MSTTTIMSRAAAVVGALLLGVSVASCSDSGDGADTSTTSSTTSTSTSARATTGTTAGAGTGGDGIAVGEPTPGGGGGNGGGGGGGGDPVDDRCSLEALSQAYGDGPGDIVGVAHCDGDWAVSQGSDDSLNRVFMHRDHGWVGFAADSVNPTTGTACYSTDRLQQIGAPAGVRALLPWCDPGQPPEPCSIDALHRTVGTGDLDTLIWCDGLWMRAGQWQTDNVRNFYLGGYLWRDFPADGTSEATGYPCYTQGRLDRENVPAGLRAYLMVCEDAQ